MDLLAHPFALGPDGSLATIEQGSDAEIAQTIHLIIGTRLFERPMAWSFGTPDPVFSGLRAGDIQAPLTTHGPPGVRINAVTQTDIGDTDQKVTVSYEQQS